ncbi:MAG: hypothetical protein IJ849_05360 [Selenomonadaceae bacterium]|nr:hypothetical protein [Selenomonadaceae bacterium]
MMANQNIMKEGMDCLRENLGILKAEMFVAEIIRNNFDYTEWQRAYFDAMTTDEIKQDIDEFVKKNTYQGNAVRI